MNAAKATQVIQKILVVDDDPDIVELLEYNLQKEGYEVKTAPDGRKGVQAARDFRPDLILLDIMMPQQDGIETARMIRNDNDLRDTYIMFLTARSEEYSEIAAFEVGADDYITKPIKPRALMSRINALFRREARKAGRWIYQNPERRGVHDHRPAGVKKKGRVQTRPILFQNHFYFAPLCLCP